MSQVDAWKEMGHTVRIFNLIVTESQSKTNILNAEIFLRKSIFIGNKELLKALELLRPDIIYLRFEPFKPFLYTILKKYKTVLEINTDDLQEQLLHAKNSLVWKLRYWFNKATRSLMLSNCSGMVTVTEELSRIPNFSRYKKPMLAVPNSIVLSKFSTLKKRNNLKIPQVYFMGNFNRKWHGVDKIIRLASMCKDQLYFHIVGGACEVDNIPPNVTMYGYLDKDDYTKIIEKCDVGIGSLSFHTIPLWEACPLKVREYLAYGLPIIIGYTDTAFLRNKPDWILEIPNTENNVEEYRNEIVEFCIRMKDVVIPIKEVKPFVDSNIIEKEKIHFFEKVAY